MSIETRTTDIVLQLDRSSGFRIVHFPFSVGHADAAIKGVKDLAEIEQFEIDQITPEDTRVRIDYSYSYSENATTEARTKLLIIASPATKARNLFNKVEISVTLSDDEKELVIEPDKLTICKPTVLFWESKTPDLHIIGVFGLSGETFDNPRSFKPQPQSQPQPDETTLSWRSTDHYTKESWGKTFNYSVVAVTGSNGKVFYKDPQVTNEAEPDPVDE